MGARLEYIMQPIAFGFGTAILAMVGTNWGARQYARARAIALTGVTTVAAVCGTIGVTVAIFPTLWLGLFSDDPDVFRVGGLYLHIVAPLYPLFGAGVTLYFASQGSGQVLRPVLAGTARLLFVVSGAVLVMQLGGPLPAIFAVVSMGLAVFGGLTAWVVHRANWSRA